MRILHTADLHIGQIMYQYYERFDEHAHFFRQLEEWCGMYNPDALLISGDIFDIQQPSAAVRDFFNGSIVALHRCFPQIKIVITAGNHDSAARIQADREVWGLADIKLIGHGPASDVLESGDVWQDNFIVEMPSGFIVALPFMSSVRTEVLQSLLDSVARRNIDGRPVVMMAHQAVTGSDITGHNDLGNLRTFGIGDLGNGYDYLALGHIHRPQTLGCPLSDEDDTTTTYPAGVARYSGSALHVSCDEQYPHTVSLVDIDTHGGTVVLQRLRINELRHFYVLPEKGSEPFGSAVEAYVAVDEFCDKKRSGYIRLRFDGAAFAALPSDFIQTIYKKLEITGNEVRFNPQTICENKEDEGAESERPVFELVELQQMTNPLDFIRRTIDSYPELNIDDLENDFREIEEELLKGEREK